MIKREILNKVKKALNRQSAVAVLGPRQVGKTTLAHEITLQRPSIYLDLESIQDRNKLSDPALFFEHHNEKLIILDEIHRMPEIFQTLRGVIDERRRQNKRNGQFLILGSASIELLKQSGETLAGRIEYVDLGPFNLLETGGNDNQIKKLWLRGGFPDSYLAQSDEDSMQLRNNFIRTYLERDVAMFGPRVPAETLRRLWTMFAHNQGQLLNAANLSASLGISYTTVNRYIDLLVDLLLVRRLQPYHTNVGKRLVKSPKTFVRDSGILHSLLKIQDFDDLLSHPILGNSWEGFVIENILSVLPSTATPSFYRTSAGAEIDLLIELGGKHGLWAIEIKHNRTPKIEKGFYNATQDIKPTKNFIIYSGKERYPLSKDIEVIPLRDFLHELTNCL